MSRFQRIDEFYAWVSSDDEGEGLIGHLTPTGWMPLIGADRERIESLRDIAQMSADRSGVPIKLVEFSVRTDIETLEPKGPGAPTTVVFDGDQLHKSMKEEA